MELTQVTIAEWRTVFAAHLNWANANGRCSGRPQWNPDGLNVIGIRCNALTDYYVRGKRDWNDFLILIEADKGVATVFPCTVDPADTNENSAGDAHLLEGCWDAYVRGFHKGTRRALVQRGTVMIVRTNLVNGKSIETRRERGNHYGINIHNAAGFNKPSAGCTVLKPERGLMLKDKAFARFKTILEAAPDVPSRTYCLMSNDQFNRYFGAKIL